MVLAVLVPAGGGGGGAGVVLLPSSPLISLLNPPHGLQSLKQ